MEKASLQIFFGKDMSTIPAKQINKEQEYNILIMGSKNKKKNKQKGDEEKKEEPKVEQVPEATGQAQQGEPTKENEQTPLGDAENALIKDNPPELPAQEEKTEEKNDQVIVQGQQVQQQAVQTEQGTVEAPEVNAGDDQQAVVDPADFPTTDELPTTATDLPVSNNQIVTEQTQTVPEKTQPEEKVQEVNVEQKNEENVEPQQEPNNDEASKPAEEVVQKSYEIKVNEVNEENEINQVNEANEANEANESNVVNEVNEVNEAKEENVDERQDENQEQQPKKQVTIEQKLDAINPVENKVPIHIQPIPQVPLVAQPNEELEAADNSQQKQTQPIIVEEVKAEEVKQGQVKAEQVVVEEKKNQDIVENQIPPENDTNNQAHVVIVQQSYQSQNPEPLVLNESAQFNILRSYATSKDEENEPQQEQEPEAAEINPNPIKTENPIEVNEYSRQAEEDQPQVTVTETIVIEQTGDGLRTESLYVNITESDRLGNVTEVFAEFREEEQRQQVEQIQPLKPSVINNQQEEEDEDSLIAQDINEELKEITSRDSPSGNSGNNFMKLGVSSVVGAACLGICLAAKLDKKIVGAVGLSAFLASFMIQK